MTEAVLVQEAGIESLYPRLAARVRAVVSRNVTAPEAVIEDACQVAWARLYRHRGRVLQGSELGWLCTTATREALRAVRRLARETSLDAALGEGSGVVVELPAPAPGPERVVELRERLAEVHVLPVRQRRMVWLRALGYDYGEIAARTGDTERTVERQLLRANRRLAAPASERPARVSGPARASRAAP